MTLDLGLRMRVHALIAAAGRREAGDRASSTSRRASARCRCTPTPTCSTATRRWRSCCASSRSDLPADPTSWSCRPGTVHLPLSWDDPATRLAIERYMAGVRDDAPWCPWNIEFIRRINGLDSVDDVRRIVFDASYLVLGLGDVYLGAPVATPLDPAPPAGDDEVQPGPHLDAGERRRHRRRLPVHLRDGGTGRLPVRRPHGARSGTASAAAGCSRSTRGLLRFFDQIQWYPVVGRGAARAARRDRRRPRPSSRPRTAPSRSPTTSASWPTTRDSIAAFRAHAGRGVRGGEGPRGAPPASSTARPSRSSRPRGGGVRCRRGPTPVTAPFVSTVWQVSWCPGDGGRRRRAGSLALEAMKMETPVIAPTAAGCSAVHVPGRATRSSRRDSARCVGRRSRRDRARERRRARARRRYGGSPAWTGPRCGSRCAADGACCAEAEAVDARLAAR